MKRFIMSAFLFLAVAGFANAQEVKTEKKQCAKTEKCCKKDKKDSKKSCCKDKKASKKADKATKECCKKEATKK